MISITNNKLLNRKRGNAIVDTISITVIVFILAILWFVTFQPLSDINDDMQADVDLNNESKDAVQKVTTFYPSTMDYAFAIVLVLLWGGGIIASFLTDTHPIFFVITIIALILFFSASMILSNFYEELADDPDYIGQQSEFPIMMFVMDNLLIVSIVVGFSIAIALFAKSSS